MTAPGRADNLDAVRLVVHVAVLTLAFVAGCLEDPPTFGPVGGLRLRGEVPAEACALPAGVDPAPTDCPDWSTVVWPLLRDVYNCSLNGCHLAPNDPTGVNLVPDDAGASYDALAAFVRGDRPYISETAPDTAYIMCNVDPGAPLRIGTLMPSTSPKLAAADLDVVGRWVACGMPRGDISLQPGAGEGGAVEAPR